MTKLGSGESYSREGPQCPKCEFTFTPDESIYYDENRYVEDKCPECGCAFSVVVYHATSWTCELIEPEEPATLSAADHTLTQDKRHD